MFNEDILNGLHKLQKQVTKPIAVDTIADLVRKVKTRNKLIKIADTSTGAGLLLGSMRLVQLLTILTTIRKSNRLILGQSRLLRRSLNPVLDCIPYHISHKPHQILCLPNHTVAVLYSSRPFVGAMHDGDRASGTSVSHARNMGTGRSTAPTQIPSTPGWRKSGQDQDINAPTDSKDKYSFDYVLPEWESDSNTDFDIFIEQVHYFENCGTENYHEVKGRLAKHAEYWEKISNR